MSSLKDVFRQLDGDMFSHFSKEGKYANANLNEGMKRHRDKSIELLLVELSQMNNMTASIPIMAGELSKKEKKTALSLLVIIREKRCGKIKGRVVAYDSMQRPFVAREDAAFSIIQLDNIIMSLLGGAKEGRDVSISDVVGAYLLEEMDGYVIVKLAGKSVEILCRANKKYRRFVTIEKGKEVIYLKLERALYACIQSALSWYNVFVNKLMSDDFILNIYDLCVANKMVNESQCIMYWYVHDTKISHAKSKVVTSVIESLGGSFGK